MAADTRPGLMLFFDDVRPALARLNDAECGLLLRAIMNYAQYGEVIDLPQLVAMAFDFIRPQIDRDAMRYAERCEQSRHAVYIREAKKRGEQPLSFQEWRVMQSVVSSPSPPLHPPASLVPTHVDVDIVADAGVDAGVDTGVDTGVDIDVDAGVDIGYRPITPDNGSISTDDYKSTSDIEFEKMRQAAIARLRR